MNVRSVNREKWLLRERERKARYEKEKAEKGRGRNDGRAEKRVDLEWFSMKRGGRRRQAGRGRCGGAR